ncbi:hypothetical protein [Thalassoglobus sp.]|uniref:hypothetical protein n=1 Tax=Thalassoglobus sp. TaxID=2795869 RepID=UPI003AA8129A
MRARPHFYLVFLTALCATCCAQDFPTVVEVERQPLIESTKRLVEALKFVGAPLSAEEQQELQKAYDSDDDQAIVRTAQKILDPYCVAGVHINAESRVKVSVGPARKELIQNGWRSYLVKVFNEAGINPPLQIESPNALPVYQRGKGARQKPRTDQDLVDISEVKQRFMDETM